MADSIENVPTFNLPSPEELAKIREDLGVDKVLAEESNEPTPIRPHRGRGRPRKYQRDQFGRVLKDRPINPDDTKSEESQTLLPSPPLTGRDTREIAKRLSGILVGATSVGAVLNSHIQMTQTEADNIATPLTAYLARTEATSKFARQVLDEYDLAAFVIATLAYMVRVVRDVQNERQSETTKAIEQGRLPRGIPERVPSSQRIVEPTIEPTVSETNGENAEGSERPVDRGWASIAPKHRDATEV